VLLERGRLIDRRPRRIGDDAAHDRNAAAALLASDVDHAQALVHRQALGFAGMSADAQTVHAMVEQVAQMRAIRFFVDGAARRVGIDDRRRGDDAVR